MAATTVMGLFDNRDHAELAVRDLQAAGVGRGNIDLKTGEELISRYGAHPAEEDEGVWASIRRFFGMSEGQHISERGIESVHPGDCLVSADVEGDELAERAADILDRHGAIDIDERLSVSAEEDAPIELRVRGTPAGAAGRTAAQDAPKAGSTSSRRPAGTRSEAERRIPVTEEELKIGKRPVSRGGVRIYTRTVERPVEEDVRLHDEKVKVERRPVDRPASASEGDLFKEVSYEMHERSEEPVVEKRARVKEEVDVRKEASSRTEKVRDTVRSTDVHVESLSPEEEREFARYESEFQDDWQHKYSRSGLTYDEVLPGYQYGYRLGRDPRYMTSNWAEIEPKVKRDWDERGFGPWDRLKDAVRSGWERAHR